MHIIIGTRNSSIHVFVYFGHLFLGKAFKLFVSHSKAHLSVGVVTVGGEEDLGHLLNPGQECREIWLLRAH